MATLQSNTIDKQVESDGYDRHLIPSEVVRRREREGDFYKQLPEPTPSEVDADLDTTGGYTMSREGLLNNYAVEPEMYYETPGDRTAILEREKAARQQELEEIKDTDSDGKLTIDNDRRGKGVGII
ncbi:hypothetical protein [Okeania sp. SIO2G5]|uniref:hypothetical protein n=1 Tax=Okeania sp. SIO2G5 TaxID=2607796 RepID=UPI0013C03D21|nr:hypothetical protein [Okeania sp. SIO2G5]NEP76468.1 hypothetical protein [Okeania sp. SIO2G5]